MRTRRAVTGAALAVIAVGCFGLAVVEAPTGSATAELAAHDGRLTHTKASAETARHIVLISGRDDHGERQLASIPLLAEPRLRADAVASLPDQTLVHVQQVRGTWVLVRRAGGAGGAGAASGWVDDFRLRGVVHLVGPAPSCSVSLDGRTLPAGEQATVLAVRGERARVRLVRRPDVTGWLPAIDVRELPPSPSEPCPSR